MIKERIRQIIARYYPGLKPKLLSEHKAVKVLGISYETIKDLRDYFWIHPIKRGDIYRYDKKTLEKVRKLLKKTCRICGKPVPKGNSKLCKDCSAIMKDSKLIWSLPGMREKHREYVKRYREIHTADANYRARVSKMNYEISVYTVKMSYPGFSIGEQFKVIGCKNNKLLLADGRTIPTIRTTKIKGLTGTLSLKRLREYAGASDAISTK